MNIVAIVAKVSNSSKSILVGIKKSKYSIGYDTFAWCANPDNLAKGDLIKDADVFANATTVQAVDADGNELTHEDKTPVLRWVFK